MDLKIIPWTALVISLVVIGFLGFFMYNKKCPEIPECPECICPDIPECPPCECPPCICPEFPECPELPPPGATMCPEPRPDVCLIVYDPVWGSNGKWYKNKCVACMYESVQWYIPEPVEALGE